MWSALSLISSAFFKLARRPVMTMSGPASAGAAATGGGLAVWAKAPVGQITNPATEPASKFMRIAIFVLIRPPQISVVFSPSFDQNRVAWLGLTLNFHIDKSKV